MIFWYQFKHYLHHGPPSLTTYSLFRRRHFFLFFSPFLPPFSLSEPLTAPFLVFFLFTLYSLTPLRVCYATPPNVCTSILVCYFGNWVRIVTLSFTLNYYLFNFALVQLLVLFYLFGFYAIWLSKLSSKKLGKFSLQHHNYRSLLPWDIGIFRFIIKHIMSSKSNF